MRYYGVLIVMILQSCLPAAFAQATDSPIEYPWTPRCDGNVGPGDPRWPGCIITHWYPDYQPGTISVISGSGSLSSAHLGSVCDLSIISENISGSEVTLQLVGGFLDERLMFKCIFDPGRAIGFPFPPFGDFAHEFSLSVTNTSSHPWTAFEIELQSVLGQQIGRAH